jgi:hypothetical protein
VADDAALPREEAPTLLDVPGRIEVVQGGEERDQIPGLAGVQPRARDPELAHPLRHPGQMVPQGGPQIVEAVRSRQAPEVRPDLTPDAVDGVTPGAALLSEDARPGERILGRPDDRLAERGCWGPDREQDQHDPRPWQDPVHRVRPLDSRPGDRAKNGAGRQARVILRSVSGQRQDVQMHHGVPP